MRVFLDLKRAVGGATELVAIRLPHTKCVSSGCFHLMEESKKHILIGSGLIIFFFLCLAGVAASAYLSGYSGEFGRMCLALITTPFLMETAIFFLALTLLFAINGWRRNREGDDYVTLDEKGIPLRPKRDK